jgi:MtN3 and saliva related transmembrane protein
MYVITVVRFALWTAYGIMGRQWPLIVPNTICLVLPAFTLAMKLLPQRKVDAIADAVLPGGGTLRNDLRPSPRAEPRAR